MEVDNFATISKIIKVFISDIYSSIIYSYSNMTFNGNNVLSYETKYF